MKEYQYWIHYYEYLQANVTTVVELELDGQIMVRNC
jgi:hypothetical protein